MRSRCSVHAMYINCVQVKMYTSTIYNYVNIEIQCRECMRLVIWVHAHTYACNLMPCGPYRASFVVVLRFLSSTVHKLVAIYSLLLYNKHLCTFVVGSCYCVFLNTKKSNKWATVCITVQCYSRYECQSGATNNKWNSSIMKYWEEVVRKENGSSIMNAKCQMVAAVCHWQINWQNLN